jgi:hypothetical protein
MNNMFKTSAIFPCVGFCILKNEEVYINNNDVKGFEINGNAISDGYHITLITSKANYIIYHCSHISLQEFKPVAIKIINKILESLRYDITINIHVDKIINEVLNDGKETSNFDN